MGNKLSFFILHGRRLKNRYNAQYRAIEFIGKEKLPSAPRHPVPYEQSIKKDESAIQELQKKNLTLDKYLKDLYVQSYDEIPVDSSTKTNNPNRPLPESREPKPKATFNEPKEVEEGCCTLTDVSVFLAKHDEDPITNSSAAIAKEYNLDQKKVENTLKYYTIFRVYDKVKDTVPKETKIAREMLLPEELIEEKEQAKSFVLGLLKPSGERLKNTTMEKEKEKSQSECENPQPVEKAVKNQKWV